MKSKYLLIYLFVTKILEDETPFSTKKYVNICYKLELLDEKEIEFILSICNIIFLMES